MLDVNNPIPLHVQLRSYLEREIRNGSYKDKIPSERELMDHFTISRSTVREAISALVRDGVLEKKHGRGTFIANKPVQEWLGYLKSYNETVKDMGMEPSSRLLYQAKLTSPERIAQLLDQREFYLIKRLRLANDKPVAIKKHYYPLEIGLRLAEYDLNTAVLYDLLQQNMGLQFCEAEQSITTRLATEEDSEHLDIPVNSSLLVKEQVIHDASGNVIEYSKSIFRPDMYSFNIKMSRKTNSFFLKD